MLKKIFYTICLVAIMMSLGHLVAHAYQIDPSFQPRNAPFSLQEELSAEPVEGEPTSPAARATILILQIIAGGMLYFAAPIAVIMIVISAFNMVRGGAESEKLEEAKKHLTMTIIGLLVIILSYSIVRFLIGFIIKATTVATQASSVSS